ncbi:menaquinone biosynthetic enzyme MqnA/MqnD family protein [Pelotomaculum propionicicum]|uniref:Chorismate dehydratase n=1 Tax=Pelotomaculum propionicicum TaxID=258475 RepID=A0A4Y7RVC2_9FIRM|nr:menaquinone biosynthesis protein [Pelotomaculum propionicicum]NLI13084.1 menaquinone biosynthesis protein [Peptococcaceae bacterium]TEB12944.1 Chorismate dehydratase [Pelotomaculum propionicicum]
MELPRLGYVSYINCLPVFCAMQEGLVKVPARLCSHHPSRLNSMFREGLLDVTAISSIEYTRQPENCLVLPDLSIASDGPVRSVAMVSRVPVELLAGRTVSLTPHSATSVMLLKLLLHKFYNIKVDFFTRPPAASVWWDQPDAALVIGDEALQEINQAGGGLHVYDLGAEWKRWTGRPMVFALWVTTRDFAQKYPEQLTAIWRGMLTAKKWGLKNPEKLVARAKSATELSEEVLTDYFKCLQHDLSWHHIDSLMYFYHCAAECGLVKPAVALHIWGKENDRFYRVQSA